MHAVQKKENEKEKQEMMKEKTEREKVDLYHSDQSRRKKKAAVAILMQSTILGKRKNVRMANGQEMMMKNKRMRMRIRKK